MLGMKNGSQNMKKLKIDGIMLVRLVEVLLLRYQNFSSSISGNSEANTSKFLEHLEEIFPCLLLVLPVVVVSRS